MYCIQTRSIITGLKLVSTSVLAWIYKFILLAMMHIFISQNKHMLPFTHILTPTFPVSLLLYICRSCCLNCLVRPVRLNRDAPLFLPVINIYDVSPHSPPHPFSSPFSSLWDPLFPFFSSFPFFWNTQERKRCQIIRTRSGVSSLPLLLCHYVPLWDVTGQRAYRATWAKQVMTHLYIPQFL